MNRDAQLKEAIKVIEVEQKCIVSPEFAEKIRYILAVADKVRPRIRMNYSEAHKVAEKEKPAVVDRDAYREGIQGLKDAMR